MGIFLSFIDDKFLHYNSLSYKVFWGNKIETLLQ